MSITQNVATILDDHVTPEVEGIDRMCLNVYVPRRHTIRESPAPRLRVSPLQQLQCFLGATRPDLCGRWRYRIGPKWLRGVRRFHSGRPDCNRRTSHDQGSRFRWECRDNNVRDHRGLARTIPAGYALNREAW